mmetsp:Transcript_31114/g.88227  ORF Transcript_31114/g.88227 Transcript_31114/m.88227 type:complete len:487 (+) Transcript_31114:606-2066(+)
MLQVLPFELDATLSTCPAEQQALSESDSYVGCDEKENGTLQSRDATEERQLPSCDAPGSLQGASSTDALRLLYAAKREGKSAQLLEVMLRLLHDEGRNLSDPGVLAQAAEEAQLKLNVSAYLCNSEEDFLGMYAEMEYLKEASLASVPAFLVGDDFRILTGVQSAEALEKAVLNTLNASLRSMEGEGSSGCRMKGTVLHVTISTTDIGRAATFYRDALGLTEIPENTSTHPFPPALSCSCAPTLRLRLSEISDDQSPELHLVEVEDPALVDQPGRIHTPSGTYVCLYVPSLTAFDDILTRLDDIGINTDHEERTPLTGQAFLKDRDGNTVELDTTPPAWARTSPPQEMALHHVGAAYLPGQLASARSFFQKVLGATTTSPRWMLLGGVELHLVPIHELDPNPTAKHQQQHFIAVGLPAKAYVAALRSARKKGGLVNSESRKKWKKLVSLASPSKKRRMQRCQLVMDRISMGQPLLLVNLEAAAAAH